MLKIHYHRPEGDYANWTMWTWDLSNNEKKYDINPIKNDSFGTIFKLDLEKYDGCESIGILPKFGDWEEKDGGDRIYNLDNKKDIYIVSGKPEIFYKKPDITPFISKVFIDGKKTISVILSKSITLDSINDTFFKVKNGKKRLKIHDVNGLKNRNGKYQIFIIKMKENLPIDLSFLRNIEVSATGFKGQTVNLRGILDSKDFTWNGPLGVVISPNKTSFYIYSPDVDKIEVLIFNEPNRIISKTYELSYLKNGVYSIEIPEKLSGKYYKYRVTNGENILELIDPYSKCNIGFDDFSYITDPKEHSNVTETTPLKMKDAIIYELHIRDFTISENSGITKKGKYSGIVEKGTKLERSFKIKTGLDHLKELGVNVIQIMPVQQFDHDENSEDYNWGYMPVHYFALDGYYAEDKKRSGRIHEFKNLVDKLHEEGFKVVIDVVYNHTAEGSGHPISFLGFAPWYYYRTDIIGNFENGSGCGNEFRSEAPMANRVVIDSMRYFVEYFGIDGFRYDLMGLIDFNTLIMAEKELRTIKPDILIYGEPWGGGDSSFECHGKGVQYNRNFSVFNDTFRDAMKGSVWNSDPGYIQKGYNKEKIMNGIYGSVTDFAFSPEETINYIDCHDNRTFLDRLILTSGTDENQLIKMTKFGAAILFTSQGVPFIHSGQEILRSKGGCHNSYDQPDSVNKFPWENKRKYLDVFKYYKDLIKLRKDHPMFRMNSADAIKENLKFLDHHLGIEIPENVIAYRLTRGRSSDSWIEAIVIFNPENYDVIVNLPSRNYKIGLNGNKYYPKGIKYKRKLVSDSVRVASKTAMILFKQ